MTPTRITYDDFADVLYITFGKSKSVVVDPLSDSDLVRVDSKTDTIVGVTLVGFKERYNLRTTSNYTPSLRKIVDQLLADHRVRFSSDSKRFCVYKY